MLLFSLSLFLSLSRSLSHSLTFSTMLTLCSCWIETGSPGIACACQLRRGCVHWIKQVQSFSNENKQVRLISFPPPREFSKLFLTKRAKLHGQLRGNIIWNVMCAGPSPPSGTVGRLYLTPARPACSVDALACSTSGPDSMVWLMKGESRSTTVGFAWNRTHSVLWGWAHLAKLSKDNER